MSKELLDPVIDQTGRRLIIKTASLSWILFVLILLNSGISLFYFVRALIQRLGTQSDTALLPMTHWAETVLQIIAILISIIASWHYIKLPLKLRNALAMNDERSTNLAFRIMYRGALLNLIYLIATTVSSVYWFITMYTRL
jgi:NADH:ubiquinone oxidoreductase subunit 2 (subunit N)